MNSRLMTVVLCVTGLFLCMIAQNWLAVVWAAVSTIFAGFAYAEDRARKGYK